MKPVEQRHDSDCVAACLAAIFELPIEEMPQLWVGEASRAGQQYRRVARWLAARGYHWYFSNYGGNDCPLLRNFVTEKITDPANSFPPRGYWIAQISSVDRLRDGDPNHVVVMHGRRLVFNPGGPIKEALAGPWFLIGYYLLTPLDPSKLSVTAP